MGVDIFKKYIWLISTVNSYNGIGIKELNNLYRDNESISCGEDLNERTFHRWREKIYEIFGIDIVCRKNEYYIDNKEDLKGNNTRLWLMQTIATHNMVAEHSNLKERIIIEPQPSCEEFLRPILKAMQNNTIIDIEYKKFNNNQQEYLRIAPYCLKSFHRRWYMLAKKESGEIRTYALDRIYNIKQTNKIFSLPKDFHAGDYFNKFYGIITDNSIPSQNIEIKVFGKQVHYLRTLPLHHSQKETLTTKDYSVFTFYLAPTYDFIMELLSQNSTIEVLSPPTLRNQIKSLLKETLKKYKD